jgi:hypothetical protein
MLNLLSFAKLSLLFIIPAIASAQNSQPTLGSDSVSQVSVSNTFRSAFEGYQPHTDDKTGNWKEANDTTARIGGWRAYAKEAAGSETVKSAPPSAPPAASSRTMPEPAAAKP